MAGHQPALGRCEACGISSAERALEVDHIVPRARGGSNELWNLQALCSTCNAQKSDREAVDFRAAHEHAAARHADCAVCQAPVYEDLQNELAIVSTGGGAPMVSPRRHGVAYIDLWQTEVNAMRQLERALHQRRPSGSAMTSHMLCTSLDGLGHLAIDLRPTAAAA